MHYTLTPTDAVITCTFDELVTMDSLNQAIYATPSDDIDRFALQLYIGRQPHFRYDFALATVEDFLDAEGWDVLGWEEMTQEELDARATDTHTVTVSRQKRRE